MLLPKKFIQNGNLKGHLGDEQVGGLIAMAVG